jgi:hypothetical protein
MDDKPKPEGNLRDEFGNLGKNLADMLHTAWNSAEATRVQEDVTSGLTELGATLRREAENFASSPKAQQIKDEVQQVGERVRSSEFQNKVQGELLAALQTVNNELQKVINNWSAAQASSAAGGDQAAANQAGADQAPTEAPSPKPPMKTGS